MSKKHRMSRRKSKALFTKTAMRHRKMNTANPVRGGIRL